MLEKDKSRERTISNSLFARKRRKTKKSIKIEKMLNLFRRNRKLRKRR